MREDRLSLLSMRFAVRIIRLSQFLQAKHEYIISRQIGRSGTSIGANIREAQLLCCAAARFAPGHTQIAAGALPADPKRRTL